jgi:hypothetical protein
MWGRVWRGLWVVWVATNCATPYQDADTHQSRRLRSLSKRSGAACLTAATAWRGARNLERVAHQKASEGGLRQPQRNVRLMNASPITPRHTACSITTSTSGAGRPAPAWGASKTTDDNTHTQLPPSAGTVLYLCATPKTRTHTHTHTHTHTQKHCLRHLTTHNLASTPHAACLPCTQPQATHNLIDTPPQNTHTHMPACLQQL